VGVPLRCAPGRAARAVGNDTTVANGAEPPPQQGTILLCPAAPGSRPCGRASLTRSDPRESRPAAIATGKRQHLQRLQRAPRANHAHPARDFIRKRLYFTDRPPDELRVPSLRAQFARARWPASAAGDARLPRAGGHLPGRLHLLRPRRRGRRGVASLHAAAPRAGERGTTPTRRGGVLSIPCPHPGGRRGRISPSAPRPTARLPSLRPRPCPHRPPA
jgi:hypothetical protein